MSDPQGFSVPQKSVDGSELPALTLPAEVLDRRVRPQLIKDAVVAYRANRRQGTHSTLTRAEVAGSTRKLWRQKGTGRARAGSIKNPVWRGGGTIFGPRPRDYSRGINRKQRRLALRSALFAKFTAGEVVVVDELGLEAPRTRRMAKLLEALGVEGRCLIGTATVDRNAVLSVRNIPGVRILPVSDFNAEEVLVAESIVLTRDAFEKLRGEHASQEAGRDLSPSGADSSGAASVGTEGASPATSETSGPAGGPAAGEEEGER